MDEEPTSGIERAVFGGVGRDDIDAWLRRHLQARLGGDLAHVSSLRTHRRGLRRGGQRRPPGRCQGASTRD